MKKVICGVTLKGTKKTVTDSKKGREWKHNTEILTPYYSLPRGVFKFFKERDNYAYKTMLSKMDYLLI